MAKARLSLTAQEFWSRYPADESDHHDFKQKLIKAGKMQEPVVAFCNTRGGELVVGVAETLPREIVGVHWGQAEEEHVQELARTPQPPVEITTELLEVDGMTVAVLRVEPAPRTVTQTTGGGVLVRAGPTNRTLFGDDLRRFLLERQSDPVEDQVVPGAKPGDLSRPAMSAFLRKRLGRASRDVEADLRGLHFLTDGDAVTLAGLLLFGRSPQATRRRLGMDLLVFSGSVDGPHELREKRELQGRLPELIEEADHVIYGLMRKDAVVRGLVREEVPEYPPSALREALVNAVAHRNYALDRSSIQVRMYYDAIEIQSPGRLPAHIRIGDLRTAQFSRNERIMRALSDLGFVEEVGQGIERMYRAMETALLTEPEFSEPGDAFLVRFRNQSVFAAEDRLWVSQFDSAALGPDEKFALVHARRHGRVRNTDLQRLRNLSNRQSADALRTLVAAGVLRPVGHGSGTRYVLHGSASGPDAALDPAQRLDVVVRHARRAGAITNSDVRGLLGVDRREALQLLDVAVARGLLATVGERRWRRYLPVPRGDGHGRMDGES